MEDNHKFDHDYCPPGIKITDNEGNCIICKDSTYAVKISTGQCVCSDECLISLVSYLASHPKRDNVYGGTLPDD